MRAVHFGAGNIGRGFIGQVLHDNGFELCYADTAQPLINQLNQDRGYSVELLTEKKSTLFIDQVYALNSVKEPEKVITEIQTADLITTSVGASNLARIAPLLAQALTKRFKEQQQPINILANENIINASSLLKKAVEEQLDESGQALFDHYAFFVDTAIDRQALSKEVDGKTVAVVEPYFEWVISQQQWNPATKFSIKGATFVTDMQPFIERKLYIVNAAHAAFSYLGALFDYSTVQAAMKDADLKKVVQGFLAENKQYFIKKYKTSETEMDRFIEKTLKRHGNQQLSDSVDRVGRSPIRKLQPNDRLVAPVKGLAELNLPYQNGLKIIAAAYLYRNTDDEEAVRLKRLIQEKGFSLTATEISQIKSPLLEELDMVYQATKQDKKYLLEGESHA
ncbi:mannitol-1-phosphate 5-dehydrogenase [Candidatus Enterococcus ferrettii]|uniref:Mannitol-1-phosphate 5-dehydrogenase n=1 Tax=Candidatus Enterococcus ferrettii TaxID=2815324 RepID=A0ABV0ESL8_9ENTE|nr:mannitol-1-phosphate 5-dehydrogenase [Enterococcus sp. 665A]MBO1342329.1 mannitol-1-phosphate 5-dehydrogenase [Enterococcus sp. 665A]